MQVIIYKQENGRIAIVSPAQAAVEQLGLFTIARKDVPAGVKFKFIESEELPETQEGRNALEFDDDYFTDGIGGDYGIGTEIPVIGYTDSTVVVLDMDKKEKELAI